MIVVFLETADHCRQEQGKIKSKGLLALDDNHSLVEWNLKHFPIGKVFLVVNASCIQEYLENLGSEMQQLPIINTGICDQELNQRDLIMQSIQIFGLWNGFPKDEEIVFITSDNCYEGGIYGSQEGLSEFKESFIVTDYSNSKICMIGVAVKDSDKFWNGFYGQNRIDWESAESVFSHYSKYSYGELSKSDIWARIVAGDQYKDFLNKFPITKIAQKRENILVQSYARVGLIGNPSDGFYGKTISFLLKNFYAEISIIPHSDPKNEQIVIDDVVSFSCSNSVLSCIKRNGYDGVSRLLLATLVVFFNYTKNYEKCKQGFTIYYETNIPRQVGLSGSSAIIVGLLKALILYYKVEIPLEIQANLAHSAEQDELHIAAGLQDRVIQTFGGLLYMDFNKKTMTELGFGIYEPLDIKKLPNLWIAYCSNPKESGKVHSNVRQRFIDQDSKVLEAMEKFASFADQAKQDLLSGDFEHLSFLMNENFNLRRSIYGDEVIGEMNLQMINLARSHRMAAKFCGSGGCIIGMHCGPQELKENDVWDFRFALARCGFIFAENMPVPERPETSDADAEEDGHYSFCTSQRLLISFIIIFCIGILVAVASLFFLEMGNSSPNPPLPPRAIQITAGKAAVSSENKICSDIGVKVIHDGGSAVDAAIATTICIGTVNSYSSGIGGGGFAIVREANGVSKALDFREEAPNSAYTDMFKNDTSQAGGKSVAVPGELKGLDYMHKKYGVLPWDRLFQPSIALARKGWEVNRILASRLVSANDTILGNPEFRKVFAPNGKLLVEGDRVKREVFADTLEIIAKNGADEFYTGSLANELVSFINENGGNMTLSDFASYRVRVNEPLHGFYHGKKVVTTPLPASGPVLISILNILEGFVDSKNDHFINIHRIVESFKFGYAQRTYYGDPVDTIYKNISDIAAAFMTKMKAEEIRKKISDKRTFPVDYYDPAFDVSEDKGTMHVSVLLSDGSAVSLTSTINLLFGSKLMNPATGIILNNEMDDFSVPGTKNYFGLPPSPYNFIQPGKRPLSSCIPTIVETDGDVNVVIGASGGSMITSSVINVLLSILNFHKDPLASLLEPRIHHQLIPNGVVTEPEFDGIVEEALKRRGHAVMRLDKYMTGVGVIERKSNGLILAAGDWRKGGEASGY